MNRRRLLSLALTPLAGAVLAACGEDEGFAEGMLPIKWDRDTCVRCAMAISDRRFAVQVRGGPKNLAFNFDDIGCATTWCSEKVGQHPWINDPGHALLGGRVRHHARRQGAAMVASAPGPLCQRPQLAHGLQPGRVRAAASPQPGFRDHG